MASNSERFRKRLRSAREAAGLTQAELGLEVGMPQGAVSEWETGPREPNIEQLCQLAEALGVSVGLLVAGETSEGFDEGVRTALNMALRTVQEWVRGAQLRTEEFQIELKHANGLVKGAVPLGGGVPVRRVAEAPPVTMESGTRPPRDSKKSRTRGDRAG